MSLPNLIALCGPDQDGRARLMRCLVEQHQYRPVSQLICAQAQSSLYWSTPLDVFRCADIESEPQERLALGLCSHEPFRLYAQWHEIGIDMGAPRNPAQVLQMWQAYRGPEYWSRILARQFLHLAGRERAKVALDASTPQLVEVAIEAGAELLHTGPGHTPNVSSRMQQITNGAWLCHTEGAAA